MCLGKTGLPENLKLYDCLHQTIARRISDLGKHISSKLKSIVEKLCNAALYHPPTSTLSKDATNE